jgi:parallel beta-helix repeat protein
LLVRQAIDIGRTYTLTQDPRGRPSDLEEAGMDHSTTTRRRPRARLLSRLAVAGVIALVLAGLPSVAGAATPTVWVVHQGQPIQPVVTQAKNGDTIKLDAGVWTEAVCINGKGLNIVGAGRDLTKIVWPAWGPNKPPPAAPVAGQACWDAWASVDLEGNPTSTRDDVSGLFFLNPAGPVTVSGLQTVNHPANGIIVWRGNGVSISDTKGTGHERYGVLAAASTNVVIQNNVEQGLDRGAPFYSGSAGVSIGDSPNANALVAGNSVRGYNLGVFVRESRSGVIRGNTVSGNCIGVLFFDDSATEIPNVNGHVQGGDFVITANTSTANNRFCIAGRDGSQRVSGVGMAVVNADHVSVKGNVIRDNVPVVPPGDHLTFPPGGLILLSLQPPPDPNNVVDPGPVSYVVVTNNTILRNVPVDIWVSREIPGTPLRAAGPGIVITDNTCGVSDPAGLC